jgi:hypothetical protein
MKRLRPLALNALDQCLQNLRDRWFCKSQNLRTGAILTAAAA